MIGWVKPDLNPLCGLFLLILAAFCFVGKGAGTVIDFRRRLRLLSINDIFQAVMAAYNLPQDFFPTFRRNVECFNYYYVLKHVTELWFLPTVWSNCLSCLCQNSFQFYCIRVQFYSVVKLHYIKVKYHSELESRCKQTRVACWRSKWGQSKKKMKQKYKLQNSEHIVWIACVQSRLWMCCLTVKRRRVRSMWAK